MLESYDIMRDELTLCNSEEEAKQLINTYGVRLAQKYLPTKYLCLIKEDKMEKILKNNDIVKYYQWCDEHNDYDYLIYAVVKDGFIYEIDDTEYFKNNKVKIIDDINQLEIKDISEDMSLEVIDKCNNWKEIDINELKEQHEFSKDKWQQQYQCNWGLDATNK